MEEEPERLAEIKGISERKAREICVQVEEKKDLRQAMIYLQKYGISIHLAVKIYQKYGLGTYSVLEENPYKLADDIEGVGFRTADEIASRIGIHTDSDSVFRVASLHVAPKCAGGTCILGRECTVRESGAAFGGGAERY